MSLFRKYNSLVAVAGLSLMALTACDDSDGIHFTPGVPSGETEVYISSTTSTYFELDPDQTTVSITMLRNDDSKAVTVGVTVSPLSSMIVTDAFNFPKSVTFPAGSKEAEYVITYTPSRLEYDDEAVFFLELEDQYKSQYGASEATITLVLPAPWTELGVGKVGDNFWGVSEDPDPSTMIDVHVYQNDLNPNRFRINNPYYVWNEEDTYFEFVLLNPGEVVQGVTITLDNLVYFPVYFAEYIPDWGGDVYIFWPGDMADLGYPIFPKESDWIFNYVVAYQDNGLPGEIHLSPLYIEPISTTWAGADTASGESITILFPGFEQLDLETEVTYEGMLTDASQALSVIADVTIGADIESAKVAVGAGTDIDAIASAIKDGSIQTVEVTEDTQVRIPFDDANAPGKYSVVVVGYHNGAASSTASATFNWQGLTPVDPDEGWTSLGFVRYTDGYVCAAYLVPNGTTYYVQLQESQKKKGYYRLVDPYGEAYPYNDDGDYDPTMPSYLLINGTDPDFIYIELSPQSFNWGRGELECYSYSSYFMEVQGYPIEEVKAAGYGGWIEDGIMTFPDYPVYTGTQTTAKQANTELLSLWGGEGYYYANYEIDYDKFIESGQTVQDFVYAPNGYIYAPWRVDMNTSTTQAVAKRDNARIKAFAKKFDFHEYAQPLAKEKANQGQYQIKNIHKLGLDKHNPCKIGEEKAPRTLKRRY